MKIYFIANSDIDPENFRASAVVQWHWVMGPFGPNGIYLGAVSCNSPIEVRALLESAGATPLPALMAHHKTLHPTKHVAPLAFAGVTAADNTWTAAEKLHAAFPWVGFDPEAGQ